MEEVAQKSVSLLDRIVVLDERRDMPLHAQVRRALRNMITEHFEDGERFFTEPELIAHLQVSQSTVRRAMLDLVQEGLLVRFVAKGSFVKKSPAKVEKQTVGVFLPDWSSSFLSGLLEHVSDVCRTEGLKLQIYHTHKGERAAEAYRQLEHSPAEESILLLANEASTTRDLAEAFMDRGYRVVNVDTLLPDPICPFVGIDNDAVVEIGLQHLRELGHERITLVANEPAHQATVQYKIAAFERLMNKYGAKHGRVFNCGAQPFQDSYQVVVDKIDDILDGPGGRPTALFAVSDPGAWGALKGLHERGISVPGEVSVLGFSDDRPSRYTNPALTTIGQPHGEIIRRAVEMLRTHRPDHTQVLLQPHLVRRESTALAPK